MLLLPAAESTGPAVTPGELTGVLLLLMCWGATMAHAGSNQHLVLRSCIVLLLGSVTV
jgi:hypothetical protein